MSLRYEEYRALKMTKQFLMDLILKEIQTKTVKEIKNRASRCLHHFPPLNETGKPIFSRDKFTDEEGNMVV